MTEDELLNATIYLASLCGWLTTHFRAAKTDKGYRTAIMGNKGFPDLVMVRERVVYAELKSDKGRMTHDQMEWSRRLIDAGQEWYLWRPAEWLDGSIERTLR
jgi:hypothetical protein